MILLVICGPPSSLNYDRQQHRSKMASTADVVDNASNYRDNQLAAKAANIATAKPPPLGRLSR
jgi:hypothetical protein